MELVIFIALGAAFTLIWMITYIPLYTVTFGRFWSPRLFFTRFMIAMDITFTMILIAGGWVGLSTVATGIGMVVYNVMTGIGLSIGILIVRKIFIPRWEKQFNQMKTQRAKFVGC